MGSWLGAVSRVENSYAAEYIGHNLGPAFMDIVPWKPSTLGCWTFRQWVTHFTTHFYGWELAMSLL